MLSHIHTTTNNPKFNQYIAPKKGEYSIQNTQNNQNIQNNQNFQNNLNNQNNQNNQNIPNNNSNNT
jgi:hypothetical protein